MEACPQSYRSIWPLIFVRRSTKMVTWAYSAAIWSVDSVVLIRL